MSPATLEILKAALRADETVTARDQARFLALLRNGPPRELAVPAVPTEARLVRRAEAARRLGGSLRLVDRLARDGILRKHRLPGRQRAQGILESDLVALLTAAPVQPIATPSQE